MRLLTWGAARPDVEALLAARVEAAVLLRQRLFPDADVTSTYRLVHAEGDRLPGLVVDRYGDVLVAQWATAAMAARRELLARQLLRTSGARTLVSRPAGYEAEEGIDEVSGAPVFELGAPCPERIEVLEAGMRLVVEPRVGQKTGHFLDQRDNRALVRAAADGADVLDVFCSTGGFAVAAAAGGARSVHLVDIAAPAVEAARRNLGHNMSRPAVRGCTVRATVGDAFEVMAALAADPHARFDIVLVDPPSFAQNQASVGRALRAYAKLTSLAIALVRPGGTLVQASCSSRVTADDFAATVLAAAGRSARRVHELRRTGHAVDHPVGFAQGAYLKAIYLRVE